MTVADIEKLLTNEGISYKPIFYDNRKEYYAHITCFSNVKTDEPGKVLALTIYSLNGHKNLELQFNETGGEYLFYDLWFGDFSYELFDCPDEILRQELMYTIHRVMERKEHIIIKGAIGRKRNQWLFDGCYVEDDGDCIGNMDEFYADLKRIEGRNRSLWHKIFHIQIQYEIYDWNNYRCINK